MAHGDYTGNSKAALAQQYAEQQQLAAQSKTLVTQVVREHSDETVDLMTDQDYWAAEHTAFRNPADGDNAEVQVIDVKDPNMQPVKFRSSETLDQITVGKDREFSLKAGRTYTAPRWVVTHLDEKGVVYH